eukprot:CAMPEP_0168557008 /NCGR_PEP_ID=MMETSP0413-20121227/9189_1 /TAXON_ID=136452 /ORGANISM="Filamoeba nolandi, Strain NC-AS-23-1" /LENGTH=547 /DNA_ID=CAMNT_0008587997 /DNA_START=185 /DNA_END=1828 /DNA_ORIENTATION=-
MDNKYEQNRAFLESLKQNPKELLSNFDKLSQLLNFASPDDDTLIGALFSFYEVHRKEVEFIDWLVRREIQAIVANPQTLNDALLFQLFSVQFFGDRGKRYLSELVEPLVKRVVQKEDSMEGSTVHSSTDDSSSVASGTSIDIPQEFVIEETVKFVQRLLDTRDECPLGLRESFNSLCKAAKDNKIPIPFELGARYFLIKCICPLLPQADKVMVLEEHLGEISKSILQEISKVLLFVANGKVEEGAYPDLGSLVPKLHADVITFMDTLANDKVCSTARKVFLSSVTPPTQDEIDKRENLVKQRIADHITEEESQQATELYQQRYEEWMEIYEDPNWKILVSENNIKLPAEYHVWHLRTEDSPLFIMKYTGRFKVDFKVLAAYIDEHQPEVRNDPRIEGYEKVQIFGPGHYDYFFKTPAAFPMAAREYLCTRFTKMESENRFTSLAYSINRPDRPITKKAIRGIVELGGVLLTRDETDPQWTNFDFIFRVDLKGSIPAWLINSAINENMKSLKALAKLFTSLNPANNVKYLPGEKKKKEKKIKKSSTKK